MTLRSFLYQHLLADTDVTALIGDRVIQASAMKDAVVTKPYVVYHMGNDTNEMLADDHSASRQFFQIYIHDEPGDYQRIDQIIAAIKKSLVGVGSKAERVTTTRYLETSQDFDDETLRTVFRYMRFQFIRS